MPLKLKVVREVPENVEPSSSDHLDSKHQEKNWIRSEEETLLKTVHELGGERYLDNDDLWLMIAKNKVLPGRSYKEMKEHFMGAIIPNIHSFMSLSEAKKFIRGEMTKSKVDNKQTTPKTPNKVNYSSPERTQLIQLLLEHKGNIMYSGNAFWKTLDGKLKGRSWQSMRDHFLKSMHPKLESLVSKEVYEVLKKKLVTLSDRKAEITEKITQYMVEEIEEPSTEDGSDIEEVKSTTSCKSFVAGEESSQDEVTQPNKVNPFDTDDIIEIYKSDAMCKKEKVDAKVTEVEETAGEKRSREEVASEAKGPQFKYRKIESQTNATKESNVAESVIPGSVETPINRMISQEATLKRKKQAPNLQKQESSVGEATSCSSGETSEKPITKDKNVPSAVMPIQKIKVEDVGSVEVGLHDSKPIEVNIDAEMTRKIKKGQSWMYEIVMAGEDKNKAVRDISQTALYALDSFRKHIAILKDQEKTIDLQKK